jgi:hypothetical protein
MKKSLFILILAFWLAFTGCASPVDVAMTQPLSNEQAATLVAATMQALSSNPPAAVTPEVPAELLPHALYYLGNDGLSNIAQVYRLERDGKTRTQLTSEPNCKGVDGFDVSTVDGTLAYIADNQLVLANADGSNRRVLADGGLDTDESDPCSFKDPLSNPVFAPDGQTIAYARGGLNLYDISTGVSKRVIEHQRTGLGFPIETYSPVRYSPDGTRLLVAMGQWEAPPATVVYYPDTNALVRIEQQQDGLSCCSQHGGPAWSPDGSSFYGVAIPLTFCCQTGELWRVDAGNGTVARSLKMTFEDNGTFSLPKELYPSPDGQLYFFFGTYRRDSGFVAPRLLNLVHSAPDGETNRAVLRDENFVMLNGALWAPDASFVIVATAPSRDWNQDGGVLELYYTDAQKEAVWLAPFGYQMKWGP